MRDQRARGCVLGSQIHVVHLDLNASDAGTGRGVGRHVDDAGDGGPGRRRADADRQRYGVAAAVHRRRGVAFITAATAAGTQRTGEKQDPYVPQRPHLCQAPAGLCNARRRRRAATFCAIHHGGSSIPRHPIRYGREHQDNVGVAME